MSEARNGASSGLVSTVRSVAGAITSVIVRVVGVVSGVVVYIKVLGSRLLYSGGLSAKRAFRYNAHVRVINVRSYYNSGGEGQTI